MNVSLCYLFMDPIKRKQFKLVGRSRKRMHGYFILAHIPVPDTVPVSNTVPISDMLSLP